MTTPSIVVPSTSVVLLDSRQYTGPIVVQLASLKTIGALTTVRDIGGDVSNTKPIILSTVSGIFFNDGTSSFSLRTPYETVTFQPKTQTTYELLNTFGFPLMLSNTYASSMHASVIIANSSINAYKNIQNIAFVSTLNQYESTIFYGPVVLNNSLTVSSPMTYITETNAVNTDTGVLDANNFSTLEILTNNLTVNNINIVSSYVNVVGSTIINNKIVLYSSFTTQSNANVIQVDQLNSLTISTAMTTGNLIIENNYNIPFICSLSTIAQLLETDILTTNNFNVLSLLSTGEIIPRRSAIKRGFISSVSTTFEFTRNLSANLTLFQNYNVSSFAINDSVKGSPIQLWANNSSIYAGNTVISFFGQEAPSLPSTVEGLGSIGYLSSKNLSLEGFSTGQVFTRTISTITLNADAIVEPTVSTFFITANNLVDQVTRAPATFISSATAYSIQASMTRTSNVNIPFFSVGRTLTRAAFTNTFSTGSFNASTFATPSLAGLRTNVRDLSVESLTGQNFNASSISASNNLISTIDVSNLLSANYIRSLRSIKAYDLSGQIVSSIYSLTSTLVTTEIFFNYSTSMGTLFYSSGIFYASNQALFSLDKTESAIVSTTVGIGSLGYLSSIRWPFTAFSTQQILANNVFASSFVGSAAQIQRITDRQIRTNSLETSVLSNRNPALSSLTANNGVFSTIRVQNIASENLVLNSGSIVGNNFLFQNLTTDIARISSVSSIFFITSSLVTSSSRIVLADADRLAANTVATRVFNGGKEYTLEKLTTRTTAAIRTDSGLIATSSFYAPIVSASNFSILMPTLFTTRITASTLRAPTISTPAISVREFDLNIVGASTVRTSTLTLNARNNSILEITPSNSRLYVDGDWLQLNTDENNNLISTVTGLGQIPYISSFDNSFLAALSCIAIFARQMELTGEFTTTNLFASTIGTNALTTLSAGINTITAQSIALLSSANIRQIRPALQITDNVNVSNWSTLTISTVSTNAARTQVTNIVNASNISSISILNASLSSLSVITIAARVSTYTADSMAVNIVSTGLLRAPQITSINTRVTSRISSSSVSASSIQASLLSSIETKTDSASVSSLLIRTGQFDTLSSVSINARILSTINLASSNIGVSSLSINTLPISISSGVLFIVSSPIESLSSIQRTITSTNQGLGTLAYLSTYNINSLSTQQILASSISSSAAAVTAVFNRPSISSFTTSSILTSSIRTSSINVLTANGDLTSLRMNPENGQVGSIRTSTINIGVGSEVQVFTNSSYFFTMIAPYLQPESLVALNSKNISSVVQGVSTTSLQATTVFISSAILSSLTLSSLQTTLFSSSNLQVSSISIINNATNSLSARSGSFSSIQAYSLQVNSLQNTSISSIATSSIVNQAAVASLSQVFGTSLTTIVITSQSTAVNAANALKADNVNLSRISVTSAISLQTNILSSLFVSTQVTSTSSFKTAALQTSSIAINNNVNSVDKVFASTSQTSSFSFLGQPLTYTAPNLYLNGVNVINPTDTLALSISTGQTTSGLINTSSLQVNVINTGLLNTYSTVLITSSAIFNSRITASSLVIPNLEPTTFVKSALSILSSHVTARAAVVYTSQISANSIEYNTFTYSNLRANNLIVSTFNIQGNLTIAQPLYISSVGGSSNSLFAAEGALGLFYNNMPVGISTFTSSATTVATNGSIYVAGGKAIPSFWGAGPIGSTILATSADGQTWIPNSYQGIDQGVNRVIWTGNQFIAVGDSVRGATIAVSPDGLAWSAVLTSSIFTSVNGIVQGKKGFVAIGEAIGSGVGTIMGTSEATGTAATSPDGRQWTSTIMPLSSVNCVATNGAIYVAGGSGIATSVDGKTWSNYNSTKITDIAFNGVQFVAVGQEGILTSPDGSQWTNQLSTVTPKRVSWDGVQWLAAAPSSIYYSADGSQWTSQYQAPQLVSTFTYTGVSTLVTAPPGTNYVKIQIWGAGGAGGQSTFDPYYLASNQLWLDAQDQTTVFLSTNTSTVQVWADKSPNALITSTTTLLPPAYYSTVIAFTNSTGLSAPPFQPSQQPFAITLIGQINSPNTSIFSNTASALTVSSAYLKWQTAATINQISTNSTLIIGLTTTLSTLTWRINGQEDSIQQGAYSSLNGFTIGQGQFQLNEAIFFNSNMSNIQQVEGYFANKWSTLSLLPQQHPYRSLSSIRTGGAGAYVEGIFPLQQGLGSTFGIFVGEGGKFNTSTAAKGAYFDGSMYLSTSGGVSYDSSYGRFIPSYFSSLGLWLDGADPLGTGIPPSEGAAVQTWLDKSVQGRTVHANGQNGYYSSGYVYLSSSAYQIDYQNFNSSAYTIFTVQLLNSNEGTYQPLLSGGATPTLFSGILSNSLASFTGYQAEYNDTSANSPLVDATSWHLTDMLVVNNTLQPFVDGQAQTQKIGITGSLSTLFVGSLSPSLQNYIGSTQNIAVFDNVLSVSTLFLNQTSPNYIDVYDSNAALSTIIVNQPSSITIDVYDPSGSVSTLSMNQNQPVFLNFYDPDNTETSISTIIINNNSNFPLFIDVYDPDQPLSTIMVKQSYLDSLTVYDPSLSAPYSSFSVYKPFIQITSWQGRVGEILCFDSALSLKQRQIVEGYLASKWNLQSNLPINHPYRYQNIYTSSVVKGLGGGGAASGILLPNGQAIVAAGGGGGGQGTSWDGGAGGLDIGQRGSFTDSSNSYGYSVGGGLVGGGGGSNQGGQGASASNGAVGGQGSLGRGGSGGADGWHLALPGGGGGGGFYGGGGGALAASPGGGSSWWRTVGGFIPSLSYSRPGLNQGGYAGLPGSDGVTILTFLSVATTNVTYNSVAAIQRGSQNVGIGQINLQTGLPLITNMSTIMLQSFQSTLVLNNTLYVDKYTNRASIKTSPVSSVALAVNGTIIKTAGSFVIDDPTRDGYKIKHSFVESPTAGDTIYRWLFSTVGCRFEYTLPSWFTDLNTNPQVWVQPMEFYQQGRGYVGGNILTIETTADGLFEVLCVATRKDKDAIEFFKTVEYN